MLTLLAKLTFKLTGWQIAGEPVDPASKCVIVVAYHTSNWDTIPCLGSNLILGTNAKWVGKHSIFWWPLGPLLRSIGGIAVRRHTSKDFVTQIVEEFDRREHFLLAIAPEGTRKRVDRWKTGFYYIALKAKVPLQPAALDYPNRKIIFGPLFYPSGDYAADMRRFGEFYRPYEPKNPLWANKDFHLDVPAR